MDRYSPPKPSSESFKPSFVGAIAELHRSHELRAARAERVRNARVAGLDGEASRACAELAPRFGGSVVAVDRADLVVRSPDGPHPPRSLRTPVVDTDELQAMTEAYEQTFRPASAAMATQRAVMRAAGDVMAARRQQARGGSAAAPRPAHASGMHARGGGRPSLGGITQAERDFEQRARENAA